MKLRMTPSQTFSTDVLDGRCKQSPYAFHCEIDSQVVCAAVPRRNNLELRERHPAGTGAIDSELIETYARAAFIAAAAALQ
jgi:hypothetical protein